MWTAADLADDLAMRDVHYFDAACALYWYCADHHGGQGSEEYQILCALEYHPSANERGPQPDSTEADIYTELGGGVIDPPMLLAWIKWQYAAAHNDD